jgi:hypothetical protein
VTGKRLLIRFITVFLGTLTFFAFLSAVDSHAQSIKADPSSGVVHGLHR